MSFLSSIFLFGLPLLAIPVAIHLLNRRQQQIVKWAAMEFLLDSNIKRRKIWRMDDLLLLLLRTAAVLGVVLALARPVWYGSTSRDGRGRDVIFVWDVSLSTERAVNGKQTSFDRIVEKSTQLMDQLGPLDTVRGLVTIGRGQWLSSEALPATADQKRVLLDRLNQMGTTEASADWIACLGTAIRAAAPREARARLLVVVTDDQASGWKAEDSAAWQNVARLTEESKIPLGIEVYQINETVPASRNLAVDRLSLSRTLLGIGESLIADAEIHNYDQYPVELVTVDWKLNDLSVGKSSVGPIAPGQFRRTSLKHAINKPGVDRLSCRIDVIDDLPSDNQRTVIVETVDEVPVLLVDDSSEDDPLKSDKGYFLAALGYEPGGEKPKKNGIFKVTTVTSKQLADEPWPLVRAIVFANTPDLGDVATARLMEFVRTGGGLWLALGDRTHSDPFNTHFYRSGAGLCPWPIHEAKGDLDRREEFVAVHPPEGDHPATALLGDTQRLDIDRVKVFQRFPFAITPANAKVPVLLQSSTGEALAIEGFLGRGRVFIQSLPMGVRWSNMPLTQAYVPMVHEWLWYLVQPTVASWNLRPGDLLQVSLPQNEQVREVQLKRPNGSSSALAMRLHSDQTVAQSRDTQQPGSYFVTVSIEGKDDQRLPFQVTRPAEESNLDPWPAELATRWNEIPAFRLNPTSPLQMPTGVTGQRQGEPIWTLLLLLVIFAFFAELWLVRRAARRRFGGSEVPSFRRPFAEQLSPQPVGLEGKQ